MFEKSEWIWCDTAPETNAYVDFYDAFAADAAASYLRISCSNQYVAFLNGQMVGTGQYADLPEHRVFQTHAIDWALNAGENHLLIRVFYQGIDTLMWQKGKPGLIYEVEAGGAICSASTRQTRCASVDAYENDVPLITIQMGYSFVYHGEKDRQIDVPPPGDALRFAIPVDIQAKPAPRPTPMLDIERPAPMRLNSQGVFLMDVRQPESSRTDVASCAVPPASGSACQYAALAWRDRGEMVGHNGTVILTEQGARIDGRSMPDEGLHVACEGGDGCYLVLVAEENVSGLLTLDLEAPEGTRIDIAWGEHLDDLRVRSRIEDRNFCATCYTGRGRRQFTYWFRRIGARCLELFIHSHEATVYYAGIRPQTYPVDPRPKLTCRDHMHQAIYETAKKTLHNCMHEHFEDCPWREQSLYAVDSRMQMLCAYYGFGEYTLPRESIRLMGQAQRPDGLLAMCVPGRLSNDLALPSFAYNWPCQLAEYVLYSGDLDFGREMLPIAEKLCEIALSRRMECGLVPIYQKPGYFNFYEWKDGLDGEDVFRNYSLPTRFDFILNGYLILAIQSVNRLRAWLGMEKNTALERGQLGIQVAAESFWDPEMRAYSAYMDAEGNRSVFAQLTQAIAILSGVCPTERRDELAERLWMDDSLIQTTLSFAFFRYEALLRVSESWLEKIMEEIAQRWGKMLLKGDRTFWETDLGSDDFNGAGSLCHGWSAIPIYFYYAYGAGIRPVEPGRWELKKRRPACGQLFVNAKVVTPQRVIDVGAP